LLVELVGDDKPHAGRPSERVRSTRTIEHVLRTGARGARRSGRTGTMPVMGATATTGVFHYDRYTSCVVPAFRRLLQAGEPGPWLAAAWAFRNSGYPATRDRPFELDSGDGAAWEEVLLAPDLSAASNATGTSFRLPTRGTRENLVDLFTAVVSGCC